MVYFDTARNEHNTCDCPVLKNLGFKIDKRTPSDNPQDAASRVATEIPPSPDPPAPAPAPSLVPPQASGDLQPGSIEKKMRKRWQCYRIAMAVNVRPTSQKEQ